MNRAAAPRLPVHAHRFPALLAAGGLALLTAGCGLVGSTTTASSSSSSRSASSYQTCLRQHGVSIPAARPTARPSGGSGGFGRAGGSGSAFAKAAQACASLRPGGSGGSFAGGGFGGAGFGGFGTAISAFRSCMAAHGETIPDTRPTARPTAPPASGSSFASRLLNGLNPDNAKVAAALKACQSKLPSFTPGG